MLPVVTPQEMAEFDRSAPETTEELVERAGSAVARTAAAILTDGSGGVYGRRVVVVAGRGNNGNDGRSAAKRLRGRGASVALLDAASLAPGARLPHADLVIDAAYGTGLTRRYAAPDAGATPVLAVDIPSGLSGTTGLQPDCSEPEESGRAATQAVRAVATVTFGAFKPGLLLGDGPELAGRVELAPIGLEHLAAQAANIWLVTDADVASWLPKREREAHKWETALQVVAGSPGMHGAPWLVSRAALRAGAGYVRLAIPGSDHAGFPPSEVVVQALAEPDWTITVLNDVARCRALVIGPGLADRGVGPGGRGPMSDVGRVLVAAPDTPAVVDADGLNTLGTLDAIRDVTARRRAATILTPHGGEFTRLSGQAVGADRIAAVREAARRSGAIVLLKGSTTVVAEPGGKVFLSSSGSPRLATAGTGDVLSGVIGALLARGVSPAEAAAIGAHVHGRAASGGFAAGLVAGDLPDLVAGWLSKVADPTGEAVAG